MNDKYILERIELGKISSLKTSELHYILDNEVLREKLVNKLDSGEVMEEEYTDEVFGILKKYPDAYRAIFDGHLRSLEKRNKKMMFQILIVSEYESFTESLIEEYRKTYLEDFKQILLEDPGYYYDKYTTIDWPEIIDFIADNNIEILFDLVNINNLDLSKESHIKVLKKRIDYLYDNVKTTFVSNIDVIEYLINNSFDTTNIYYSFNREDYTNEELERSVKLIPLLSNFQNIVESKQLCKYIVDNNLEDIYKYMNPNYLTLDDLIKINKEAVDLVKAGERDDYNISLKTTVSLKYISDFNLIKQILDNKIEFYYSSIDISNLKFEEYLQIKDQIIENHKMLNPLLNINKDIVKDIIKTRTKELYSYTTNSWDVADGFNVIPIGKEDIDDFMYYLDYLVENSPINTLDNFLDYLDGIVDNDPVKKIDNFFTGDTLLNNKYIVEYIVFNKIEYIKHVDLNALELKKENIDRLIELTKKGIVDHPVINILVNKNESEINKFIELFKRRGLNERQVGVINDAFQQAIFREDNPDIKNIFSIIKEKALDNNISIEDKEEYINILIKEFMDCVPKYYEQVLSSNNIEMPLQDKKELFIREVLHKVLIDNEFVTNLDILHEITDIYVAKKANEYSSKNGIDRIAGLGYEYDIKDNERIINKDLFNYLKKNYYDILLSIVKSNGYTKDSIEGPDIKEAKRIFVEWFNNKVKESNSILPKKLQFLFKDEVFIRSLKRDITYDKKDITLGSLLGEATVQEYNMLFENVISNNTIYQKLLEVVSKYKVLDWIDAFGDSIDKLSGKEVSGFISFLINYDTIFRYRNSEYLAKKYNEVLTVRYIEYSKANSEISKNEFERLYGENIRKEVVEKEFGNFSFSIVDILRDTMSFDKHNLIYRYLLGEEEFRLIKANPGPNAASCPSNMTKGEFVESRLSRAAEMSLKMLDKKEVTIPSFREVLTLSNGKRIAITVGNKTSTKNLVLGEKTGACMRIDGVGKGLLEFCSLDPRGLHIIFEEPDTERFVSRISGYRQGNTLFLNQLRKSESVNYTNNDLVEAMRMISKMIIDKSFEEEKAEEIPIENVIASSEFALENEKAISPPFKTEDVQLPTYSDVGTGTIVVLGTKGDKLAPIKINPDNQHVYLPVRTIPKTYLGYSTEADSKYKRIRILEECRKHPENLEYYKELEDEGETELFEALIVADDWAVVLTNDLKIEMINVSIDERSFGEIEEALKQINNIKEEIMMGKEVKNDTEEFKAKR